jgi:pyrroline-5-carboxylate reductase
MQMKIKPLKYTIAFLGACNMAEALISGIVGSGLVSPAQVLASDVRPERREYMKKKFRIRVYTDNTEAVRKSDIVFFAVKPQQMPVVLKEIGPCVTASKFMISIAAGITTRSIERSFKAKVPVIRAMPNTPALLSAGAIAVARGKYATPAHQKCAEQLFSTVGITVALPEKHINAVTALSGSGPAYVFYLTEAMIQAGKKLGLPKDVAVLLARQTVFGAGSMLARLPLAPEELRRNVTSPGGTTAAAIGVMESKEFLSIVEEAVRRACERARELST